MTKNMYIYEIKIRVNEHLPQNTLSYWVEFILSERFLETYAYVPSIEGVHHVCIRSYQYRGLITYYKADSCNWVLMN